MPAPETGYRGRFAPSPTGPLHFGSLAAAFGSWLYARHADGAWLVRVEDLDPPREIAGATEVQLATLAAFGLESDAPVLRQSARGAHYQAALLRLLAQGDAFECRCSRSELGAEEGIHRGCVGHDRNRPAAIRVRAPDRVIGLDDAVQGRFEQNLAEDVGDFVIRRADGLWAYQLAVVVDDAAQGITEVVRGADLLDSTPRQRWLQQRLGLPSPSYAHLPLIVDADGRKLSKSTAALPVDPADPLPALRAAWRILGQDAKALESAGGVAALLAVAQRTFDPGRIPRVRTLPLAALHNAPVTPAD